METKDIILELRTKNGMSQDELAEKLFVTRQARAYMKEVLPKLDYWKRYEELSDDGQFKIFK